MRYTNLRLTYLLTMNICYEVLFHNSQLVMTFKAHITVVINRLTYDVLHKVEWEHVSGQVSNSAAVFIQNIKVFSCKKMIKTELTLTKLFQKLTINLTITNMSCSASYSLLLFKYKSRNNCSHIMSNCCNWLRTLYTLYFSETDNQTWKWPSKVTQGY